MHGDGDVRVARLRPDDRADWNRAYARYAVDVGSPVDSIVAARVWSWILREEHGLVGLCARSSGAFAGFAHVRPFPRTLDGNEAGFLDDLYVAPAFRGTHVAREIFRSLEELARERAWTHVRWVTGDDNARARQLYDKIARPIPVRSYRLDTSDLR